MKRGIYHGEIIITALDCYSLSDIGLEPSVFDIIRIADSLEFEIRPQLREQLKQLVRKRVTVKGRQVQDSPVFDLEKGIEIIPEQP